MNQEKNQPINGDQEPREQNTKNNRRLAKNANKLLSIISGDQNITPQKMLTSCGTQKKKNRDTHTKQRLVGKNNLQQKTTTL